MRRPCNVCSKPLLILEDATGRVIYLDVESRGSVWALKDSTESGEPVERVPGEVYAAHRLICRGAA